MDEAKRLVELIPRLRRYARALVGDRSSADDLVQDTLERAWAKLHLYRRGTDLRAWLFTVMHNVHVNRVRAARSSDPLEDEMPELAQRGTQPDALLVRDLDRAIARLPADQRAVLLLVTLEDMSYDEVARTLGIPIGTVMSRLSRAREKLRAMMLGQSPLARLCRPMPMAGCPKNAAPRSRLGSPRGRKKPSALRHTGDWRRKCVARTRRCSRNPYPRASRRSPRAGHRGVASPWRQLGWCSASRSALPPAGSCGPSAR